MLTWDEIRLEHDLEQDALLDRQRQESDRDYELMNGRTVRQDVAKDHSGPEWQFTMERTHRVGDRSARP